MYHSQEYYSALIDAETGILLAITPHDPITVFLTECIPDSLYISAVNFPNYLKLFPLLTIPSTEYPSWTWDYSTRMFGKTKPHLLSDVLKARSDLAVIKCETLRRLIYFLNTMRMKVNKGIDMQDRVYMEKQRQALLFRDSNYDENTIFKYPYILQYASLVDISPKDAAERIIFMAKLDDEILTATETLRLRYMDSIRKAAHVKDLDAILAQLMDDVIGNSLS